MDQHRIDMKDVFIGRSTADILDYIRRIAQQQVDKDSTDLVSRVHFNGILGAIDSIEVK